MTDVRKGMAPGYWWTAPDGSALYQCPRCMTIFPLPAPIQLDGEVARTVRCPERECSWMGRLRLLGWAETVN